MITPKMLMLSQAVLTQLDKITSDPEETITVALTKRELTYIAALAPVVVFSYPEAASTVMDLDEKLTELVKVQQPGWQVDGGEG